MHLFPVGLAINRQQGRQLNLSNADPKRGLLGSERRELREADNAHGDWLHLVPVIPNRGGELTDKLYQVG